MRMRLPFILCILLLPAVCVLPACRTCVLQECDSLCRGALLLHFRFDRSLVEYDYMNNPRTLGEFDALFADSLQAAHVDTVFIRSYASPDGDSRYNARLADRRAVAVRGYLIWKYPYLDQRRIVIRPQGENWAGLRRLVEADKSVPDREEVLAILDKVPDTTHCKMLLRKLNRGYAYRYIVNNLLRYLRNAAVCRVQMRQPGYAAVLNSVGNEKPAFAFDACPSGHDLRILPVASYKRTALIVHGAEPDKGDFKPVIAVKTNLLFDLALAPNVEIELPLGSRWSLNAEWMFPWWLTGKHDYCYQILSGGLEGRYWLGRRAERRTLTGHFLGLYAGGGEYDLQWKENGYQGEFYIASGISYGYAMPLARRLNLEFSIGIGLLRTNYEHYHATNNYQTLLWQNNGNYTWFGPTKAKISLVWLLGGNANVRKGGAQ